MPDEACRREWNKHLRVGPPSLLQCGAQALEAWIGYLWFSSAALFCVKPSFRDTGCVNRVFRGSAALNPQVRAWPDTARFQRSGSIRPLSNSSLAGRSGTKAAAVRERSDKRRSGSLNRARQLALRCWSPMPAPSQAAEIHAGFLGALRWRCSLPFCYALNVRGN